MEKDIVSRRRPIEKFQRNLSNTVQFLRAAIGHSSAKTRVTLIATALFLVSLLLVSAIQFYSVKAEMRTLLAAQQHDFVNRVAGELDQKLLVNLNFLDAGTRTIPLEFFEDIGKLETWAAQRQGLRAIFNDIFVVSPKGVVLADTPTRGHQGIDVSGEEYFRTTLEKRKPYISKPYVDKGKGQEPMITFAAPLIDKQGGIVAVLTGSLNLLRPNFLGELSEAKVGKSGSFEVLARDRTIVISRDQSRILRQGPAPGVSTYFDRATSGSSGSEEGIDSAGRRAIFSFSQLKAVPWVLVASLPLDEAYAPIQAAQQRILQVSLLLALLVAPLVWFAVRRMFDPLQAALRVREAGLQRAQSVALLAHVVTGPDGDFEDWSDTLSALIGQEPARVPRSMSDWLRLVHPDDRTRVRHAIIDRRTTQERADVDYRLQRSDGAWIEIRHIMETHRSHPDADRSIRWFHTIQDITERKRAEEAVRISQERLAAIVSTAMDAIITVNEDQQILLFNAAAETIFRCAASEAIGHPLDRFLPERFRPVHAVHIRNFGATGVTSRTMHSTAPIYGKRSDGEEFPCEATISQAITGGGQKLYTVILRDITQRKQAEQLRQLAGHLLEARDQERKEVASQLHEDIAQSLATLGMYLSSTQNFGVAANDEATRFLEEARALLRRSSSDIRTLAGVLYPLALDNLGLAAAVQWYARNFAERHGIELDLSIPPEFPRLPTEHELALFRVMEEALTNVQRHSGGKSASVRIYCDAREAGLEVIDTAIGSRLLQERESRIPAEGTAISEMRERMSRLGGRLEIAHDDNGTVVKAVLPFAPRRSEAAQ